MNPVTNISNITKGLINRVEICVINKIWNYKFDRTTNNNKQVVEKPSLPTLKIGNSGIIQDGIIEQTKKQESNYYEMIENGRYEQVKELMGYMGVKTSDYDLFKVIDKDTENKLYFVNCGSDEAIKVGDDIYSKDIGVGGSNVSKEYQTILNSLRWEELYQTAKSIGENQSGTITWDFDINKNSIYKMKLRFADYWDSDETPGRSMDITINDILRKEDFSIANTAGGVFKRIDLDFRVPVNNNKISLSLSGNSHLNAIEIFSLDKGDVDFVEITRNEILANKNIYLFVNKNINISENGLKRKFLEIKETTLQSRNLFFF